MSIRYKVINTEKFYTNESGFTLFELLISIAILSIIASIAIPSMNIQIANSRVKKSTIDVENILKEAKAESIINRRKVTVEYKQTSSAFELATVEVDALGKKTKKIISERSVNKNSKIDISPTNATVVFLPSKRIDGTDAITFTISDKNSSAATRRKVKVDVVANINQI